MDVDAEHQEEEEEEEEDSHTRVFARSDSTMPRAATFCSAGRRAAGRGLRPPTRVPTGGQGGARPKGHCLHHSHHPATRSDPCLAPCLSPHHHLHRPHRSLASQSRDRLPEHRPPSLSHTQHAENMENLNELYAQVLKLAETIPQPLKFLAVYILFKLFTTFVKKAVNGRAWRTLLLTVIGRRVSQETRVLLVDVCR